MYHGKNGDDGPNEREDENGGWLWSRKGILAFYLISFFYFIPTSDMYTLTCCHSKTFTYYPCCLPSSPTLLPMFEAPVSFPPTLVLSPEIFTFLTLFLLPLPPRPSPSVLFSLALLFYLGYWMAFYSLSLALALHAAALSWF